MDIHIAQAIGELMGDSGWLMRGLPSNETEFNSMFRKITGVDDNGVSIESDDPADFGITWDQVVAKQAEMQTAVDELGQAGHTIAGIKGFLADETADNVQVVLQGGVTYVADSSNALGVTGAATTILAGPFADNV